MKENFFFSHADDSNRRLQRPLKSLTCLKCQSSFNRLDKIMAKKINIFKVLIQENKCFEDAIPYCNKAMELDTELFEEHPDLLDKLKE